MKRTENPHPMIQRGLILAMAVFGILSCTLRHADVPVNGWWRSRGPVVAHDQFPADCTLCHTGGDWHTLRADFQFDHARETGVALEGAHASAECLRCHNDRGPVAAFAARGCAGCHEDVHQGMAGSECSTCHLQRDWQPTPEITNHSRTRFPLIGAHAATACWRCHPGAQVGRFDHADPECIACHASDLARATSPDHIAQGWTTGCDRCHIPTSWDGAGFNHSTFPLTGVHASTACAQCHVNGIFAGTPQDCFACHQADYNGATNPNHVAAGFPTSCEDCHDTSDWNHAVFPHSFPINGGDHGNFACSDCHITPNNFLAFSCTHCHEHRQKEMDDKHDDVNGYVWQSQACLNCHPNGQK